MNKSTRIKDKKEGRQMININIKAENLKQAEAALRLLLNSINNDEFFNNKSYDMRVSLEKNSDD